MNIKLEGIFKKIIFNGNNGYTVGLFKVLNGDNSYLNKTITITGYFPLLNVDETYIFNEDMFSLIGTNTKKRYRLGDKVEVKCVDASKVEGTIDFELKGVVEDEKEN